MLIYRHDMGSAGFSDSNVILDFSIAIQPFRLFDAVSVVSKWVNTENPF